jgi:hypothetical protein
MRHPVSFRHTFWPLVFTATLGCGQRDAGPPMGEVSGVVTYNGKPVAEASVTFFPEAKGSLPAVGVTDVSGKYQLATTGQQSGAIAGPCAVAILCRAPYDGQIPEGMSLEYAKDIYQNQGKPLIPERYFSAQTSQLTATVKPGRNTHDFKLAD